ncbi:ATP synthase F1 subunit gamma [Flammeovirgaceae bacterium SG7u.111]|nr:ATP synthase F1 subunit gamma [Flammeovirgaceae bacterium SG7u.132]WPO34872.1 ATP synthase F1 subunit gamma [Flammeovirgaceae bacterium SG7u.111]
MASLKEVKNRIKSIQSTQQITKAMKMVAAAKLRKAQDRILQMRPYAEKLNGVLENISHSVKGSEINNPFEDNRGEKNNVLIVVITSDRGLCGGFNANVIKATQRLINEKYADQHKAGNLELMCIGNKGLDFFKRRGYTINADYASLFHDLVFDNVREAVEFVMESYLDKKYDAVELVYNEFKNVATQILKTDLFLPLSPEVVEGDDVVEEEATDFIFEPSKEEIITNLIPYSLKTTFYKALLESNASEQGARMTAMDQATDNAGELLKQLRLTYNRTRQAAITKEILEIVGGAEALSNG